WRGSPSGRKLRPDTVPGRRGSWPPGYEFAWVVPFLGAGKTGPGRARHRNAIRTAIFLIVGIIFRSVASSSGWRCARHANADRPRVKEKGEADGETSIRTRAEDW